MGGWFSAYRIFRFLVDDAVSIDFDYRLSMSGRKGHWSGNSYLKRCFRS